MATVNFSSHDIAELNARGINEEEARRQISLIAEPPALTQLNRTSTIGDGIYVITEGQIDDLLALHKASCAEGRFTKFVPSSGAATRMFRELQASRLRTDGVTLEQHRAFAREGKGDSKALIKFLENLDRFAFNADLAAAAAALPETKGRPLAELVNAGEYRLILEALLGPNGLQYADLPKGLLKFHTCGGETRTPFEEHLHEALDIVKDRDGLTRLHFTVSAEHRAKFTLLFEEARQPLELATGARFAVSFSVQKPSTDTLALDSERQVFRDAHGKIVFRPGGHGALIENLNDLEGDLVYIKNIDNVQPSGRCELGFRSRKLLGGLLVSLQQETFALISELKDPLAPHLDHTALIDRAVRFLKERLSVPIPDSIWSGLSGVEERRLLLLGKLNRPMRVCGVVRNTGEPGGGPFWVRNHDGFLSQQIVEGAQIDRTKPAQDEIFSSSTHFNPVDMVCGVRDFRGRPFDLRRYTDPLAVILAKKSHAGRDLTALERPGLWNGAMANWTTIFVEVPGETFTPVKTVLDLLRPEHQA